MQYQNGTPALTKKIYFLLLAGLMALLFCPTWPQVWWFHGENAPTSHKVYKDIFVGIYNYYPFYQVKYLPYNAWGAQALCRWCQPDLRHEVLLPGSAGGGPELRRMGSKDGTRAYCPGRRWRGGWVFWLLVQWSASYSKKTTICVGTTVWV